MPVRGFEWARFLAKTECLIFWWDKDAERPNRAATETVTASEILYSYGANISRGGVDIGNGDGISVRCVKD